MHQQQQQQGSGDSSPLMGRLRDVVVGPPPLKVYVTVVSAIGLRKTDFFNTPDPFVQLSCGQDMFMSKPAKKTLSPVWNQTFTTRATPSDTMRLVVYNWRKYSKKENTGVLGAADIPLAFLGDVDTGSKRSVCDSFPLTMPGSSSDNSTGTVFLSFEVRRSGGTPARRGTTSAGDGSSPLTLAGIGGGARKVQSWERQQRDRASSVGGSSATSRGSRSSSSGDGSGSGGSSLVTAAVAARVRGPRQSSLRVTHEERSPHSAANYRSRAATMDLAAGVSSGGRNGDSSSRSRTTSNSSSTSSSTTTSAPRGRIMSTDTGVSAASTPLGTPSAPPSISANSTPAAEGGSNVPLRRESRERRTRRRTQRSMEILQLLREPLPSGWEARLTPNGQVYYANHVTRTTQWTRPDEAAVASPQSVEMERDERENYERHSLLLSDVNQLGLDEEEEGFGFPDTVAQATPPSQRRAATTPASSAASMPATTTGAARAAPVPSPQRPVLTDTTSATPTVDSAQQQQQQQSQSQSSRGSASNSHMSSGVGGSSGRRRSRSTSKSSKDVSPLDRHWSEYLIEEGNSDFPLGWEQRHTAEGIVYYVDHVNRTTTFEDPRIKAAEQKRREAKEHERRLPRYKRDLRRKLLKLRHLFQYQRTKDLQALSAAKAAQDGGERQPTRVTEQREIKVAIRVSRDSVFEDSYRVIMKLQPFQLRGKLMIEFHGEDALDYGGVAREWFYLLSKEMLNPYYGLFQFSSSDGYLLEVNPNSSINPDHLSYFRFIGRVLGLAVCHGHYIDGGFVMPLYRLLLGKNVSLQHMEKVDEQYYNSLKWMLNNDITGVIENTFTDEQEVFGNIEGYELKPGGSDIKVTEENKKEYVRLIVRHRLLRGIVEQVVALRKGFRDVVPSQFMEMFDQRELELMICGLAEVSVADWCANTEYRNCSMEDNPVVWFWDILSTWDSEMKARLLQFVTGTSRVPVTGFRDLRGSHGPKKFTLEIVATAPADSLPKAHTCFNRLDLPPYKSRQQMEAKLALAVENTVGFAIE